MQKLTKAEEEIMQMIWDNGETTVSQLIDKMKEPRPPHSSVSSIVRILEKKEFVGHRQEGRSFIYFAAIKKTDYSRFSIKRLVSNYFEGSMNELVSFLVKENDLSLSELELIKEQLKNEKA
jgi:predicted transcriptional regulator